MCRLCWLWRGVVSARRLTAAAGSLPQDLASDFATLEAAQKVRFALEFSA